VDRKWETQWGPTEAPHCAHGEWTFAGADYKRKATKWRCPTGECKPASMWIRANRMHPLIPRGTKRYHEIYAKRSSVERAFGRLTHEWGLLPLRVRGIDRVQLHADLTILAVLSCALARTRVSTLPLVA
jgi:DDE family transposase